MSVNEEECKTLASFLRIEEFRPGFQYSTFDVLGKGGTAFGVYKASDKSGKRKFAVKIFRFRHDYVKNALQATEPTTDTTILKCVGEFRQIILLKNENIVKYYFADVRSIVDDRGCQQYEFCIFMERCMGKNLYRDMEEFYSQHQTGYKASEVHQYFVGVASGLQYLHSQPHKIVHRDLRPENFIFTESGSRKKALKIADFSAAVILQRTVTMLGEVTTGSSPSWPYRAPETANPRFGEAGRRSDVWSLACILIYLLQGKEPEYPFTTRDGRNLIAVKDPRDIQEAFTHGALPNFQGDFGRRRYGDEGDFRESARELLKKCLVAYSQERPYMEAVCNLPFFGFKPKNSRTWF